MLSIDPEDAFRRLADRYGVDEPWDVLDEVVQDVDVAVVDGDRPRRADDEAVLLDAIATLRLASDQLAFLERRLLQLAHDELGLSMSQLAPALGVKSRQAAEQRYRRKVDQIQAGAAGDLSAGRAARRRRQAFAAWVADHRREVDDALRDLHAATWNSEADAAGIDPLKVAPKMHEARIGQAWELALSYAQAIASTVAANPDVFPREVVDHADTVLRIHTEAHAYADSLTQPTRHILRTDEPVTAPDGDHS